MFLSESLQYLSFFILSFIAVVSGLMVILMRNPVHSALFLVLVLFHVAGIYVLLGAEFVAMIQIMVYAGAILVLFLFVIMLLRLKEGPRVNPVNKTQRFIAPVLGLVLILEIVMIIGGKVPLGPQGTYTPEKIAALGGNAQALGSELYTTFLLPFEIASLILLVAAIGAIVLARKGFGEIEEPMIDTSVRVTTVEPERAERAAEPVEAVSEAH